MIEFNENTNTFYFSGDYEEELKAAWGGISETLNKKHVKMVLDDFDCDLDVEKLENPQINFYINEDYIKKNPND